MSEYTSYYLYQLYEKRGDQDWIPAYPNTFSVNGDGTMPYSAKTEDDPNCGYVPPPVGEYAWNVVEGYVCDDCESSETYKVMIHDGSGNTYYVSGSGEVTRQEVSGYASAATDVVVLGNATSIGNNAFSGFSGIEFARIPNTVTSIGDGAFRNCSAMTECQVPYGTTSIGASAFTNCISLAYADIPSSVTSLGVDAFTNCQNFAYVSIPTSLTSIPSSCFNNCDGLVSIELHQYVTSIGDNAFRNCSGIYSITVMATTPPTLGTDAFTNTSSNLKIYVPSASVNTYKNSASWGTYASIIYPIS